MGHKPELLQLARESGCSPADYAQLLCARAKELESAGAYAAARTVLTPLWPEGTAAPLLAGLTGAAPAEVLLRAGTLTGWLGSNSPNTAAHERAKDLLGESLTRFQALQLEAKSAETQVELGLCYWRAGALAAARNTLQAALRKLDAATQRELRAAALLHSAIVEATDERFTEAYRLLTEAAPLFRASGQHTLQGTFHNELAGVLQSLSADDPQPEQLLDRALLEYTAASFHFEQARHVRNRAGVEHSLGFLYHRVGKFAAAHEHLDRARRLFITLADDVAAAQVDETRARVWLTQGQAREAEAAARAAVHVLERGPELALLAAALTTHGRTQARTGAHAQAQQTLERAQTVAVLAGDQEGAGRAALTWLEEAGPHLTPAEVRACYGRADELLAHTQHRETLARLRTCARQVLDLAPAQKAGLTAAPFVAAAAQTLELLRQARLLAATEQVILITGDTGTGKEVLARLLHEWSGRRGRFIAVNCATLTDTLIESQLFGHARGSFTDALTDRAGAARAAAGGTLLLDEIAELSSANQSKLLRLIEHGEVQAVGAAGPERVDVRIIAATNSNLAQQVALGRFRTDLYFRLSALQLYLPPLCERPADVAALTAHFIAAACARHGKQVVFTPESQAVLTGLPLAGNARELQALIERCLLMVEDGATVTAAEVTALTGPAARSNTLADVPADWAGCALAQEVVRYEQQLIKQALEAAGGSVTRAARLLGTSHQTLAWTLKRRHADLLTVRTPARRRRRSIIKNEARQPNKTGTS